MSEQKYMYMVIMETLILQYMEAFHTCTALWPKGNV